MPNMLLSRAIAVISKECDYKVCNRDQLRKLYASVNIYFERRGLGTAYAGAAVIMPPIKEIITEMTRVTTA